MIAQQTPRCRAEFLDEAARPLTSVPGTNT
jgi:hypothetical protein